MCSIEAAKLFRVTLPGAENKTSCVFAVWVDICQPVWIAQWHSKWSAASKLVDWLMWIIIFGLTSLRCNLSFEKCLCNWKKPPMNFQLCKEYVFLIKMIKSWVHFLFGYRGLNKLNVKIPAFEQLPLPLAVDVSGPGLFWRRRSGPCSSLSLLGLLLTTQILLTKPEKLAYDIFVKIVILKALGFEPAFRSRFYLGKSKYFTSFGVSKSMGDMMMKVPQWGRHAGRRV